MMPGVKGTLQKKSTKNTARRKAWQSMRIQKRFNVLDVCRTSGAGRSNIIQYMKQLSIHGYLAEVGYSGGGRPGACKTYCMARDIGPEHPVYCDTCGQSLNAKECKPKGEEVCERGKDD